jgi:hypothetical protein
MRWWYRFAVIAALALSACDDALEPGDDTVRLLFDFNVGTFGWQAGFADYPIGDEERHQLMSGHLTLPAPLDQSRRGFHISGLNHSDDLFMFMKRKVADLVPGATYRVRFELEFATNAPRDCSGVGGAPGESVYVKAGAADVEPVAVANENYYRLNIDVGSQSEGGENALVIGHVANSNTDCNAPVYELKQLISEPQIFEVEADAQGSLWLIIGSDSGYESTTSLWYTRVEVGLLLMEGT